MIPIKSKREIALMEQANAIVLETLERLREAVRPGISTEDLDVIAADSIRRAGARPAFVGYHGYPKTLCASINEEVVHGIPSKKRKLKAGDLIGLDLGAVVDGYYGDAAITVPCGDVDAEARKLIADTEEALHVGIAEAVPGARLSNIGAAIERFATARGYTVVRDFVGHGIGTALHEEPQVHNYGPAGKGPVLREGMALAIEPMLNLGGAEVSMDADGWTVRTRDGKRSAHFEFSIAIAEGGPRILGRGVAVASLVGGKV